MTTDDQIRDEKLQYNINRKAAEISALSSGKINKYEYLTGEDILLSNQQQIIEQVKFIYSPLGKAFEKQIKTIEDQGQKQVDALNTLNNEAKKELDKIKEIEKNVDREKLIYEINEYTYIFKNFQTIKTFDRDIYEGKITFEKANEYQTNLLAEIINFKKHTKPRSQEKNKEKKLFFKICIVFLKLEKKFLMLLKAKNF